MTAELTTAPKSHLAARTPRASAPNAAGLLSAMAGLIERRSTPDARREHLVKASANVIALRAAAPRITPPDHGPIAA